ncbi:hypothetical protein DFH28DRAFT_940681 [Melampsora americana]|nr:hypothetical protein DFH28DRAFT_940681 [Melampsora americana]
MYTNRTHPSLLSIRLLVKHEGARPRRVLLLSMGNADHEGSHPDMMGRRTTSEDDSDSRVLGEKSAAGDILISLAKCRAMGVTVIRGRFLDPVDIPVRRRGEAVIHGNTWRTYGGLIELTIHGSFFRKLSTGGLCVEANVKRELSIGISGRNLGSCFRTESGLESLDHNLIQDVRPLDQRLRPVRARSGRECSEHSSLVNRVQILMIKSSSAGLSSSTSG